MKTKSSLYLVMMILLAACEQNTGLWTTITNPANSAAAPSKMKAGDYVEWMENTENGLVQDKIIGSYHFSVQYKPLEYITAKRMGDNSSKSTVQKDEEGMSDLQYYTLRIGKSNEDPLQGLDPGTRDKLIDYFSFRMQSDIKLIEDVDTLDCVLFHFERNFGLTPYCTFVMGFVNTGKVTDKTFIYNDSELGTGTVKLHFKAKSFKAIPKLITE
jgi:hypothetical protein